MRPIETMQNGDTEPAAPPASPVVPTVPAAPALPRIRTRPSAGADREVAVSLATVSKRERVRLLAAQVRDLVAAGRVDPASAVGILRAAAAVGASWAVAEEIMNELAKGADGLEGTADDVIPPKTAKLIRVMVCNHVVHDIVAWAADESAWSTPAHPWWHRVLQCRWW